jgi:putative zinc finger/helix-turn-helix YgiT family protein
MEKLICPNCESDKMSVKQIRHTSSYSNEEFEVLCATYVCKECDEQLMTSEQMNQLRLKLVDAYREKYGLLTTAQIIKYRSSLEMSQRQFADYLKVGEASIKRWETYYSQEKAMDEHIRGKCDSNYARENLRSIEDALSSPDEFTGNVKFSYNKFKNVVLMIAPTCKSPLFINKAMFYIDNLNFKRHKKSITGSQYTKLDYGPCPEHYKMLFRQMQEEKVIKVKDNKKHDLEVLIKPDLKLFDDQEIETIGEIIKLAKHDGGKSLYDLSHEEKGFKDADYLGFVSYKFAKNLKIGSESRT